MPYMMRCLSAEEKHNMMELDDYRKRIDRIDEQLISLFAERMEASAAIAAWKREHGRAVHDPAREAEKLRAVASAMPEGLREYAAPLYEQLFALSRSYQEKLLAAESALRCGLLGQKLEHSYSPAIHGKLALYSYELFERTPEQLGRFLREGEWDGLNVTIPYKKAVVPYCTELSGQARQLGSVNTLVRRADGTIYGDNTDYFGFESTVRRSSIEIAGRKAIVLGSGGASVTVCAVLRALGAESVTVISRRGENNYQNLSRHARARIIVNATPLGMYPNCGEKAVDLRKFPECEGVLDLIYNPARTALLLQAEALHIPHCGGLSMLVAQACRSCERFSGKRIGEEKIDEITAHLRTQMENIVLIGMPGCGKSTVAALLGSALHRPVYETDALVEQRAGMTIPEIFALGGERRFRALETEVLQEVGKRSGAIISTGGGCVTREENYPLLHQNGRIFYLQRALSELTADGRPVSQQRSVQELYAERKAMYERFADETVEETLSSEQKAEEICSRLR